MRLFLATSASRPAVVGDRLVTRNFGTGTIGFCSLAILSAFAVCLLPGTEVAFEQRPLRLGENLETVSASRFPTSPLSARSTSSTSAYTTTPWNFPPKVRNFPPKVKPSSSPPYARASAPPSCNSRQHPKQTPSAKSSAAPSSPANDCTSSGLKFSRGIRRNSFGSRIMPVLTDRRHERFAQELAKGKAQDELYKIAGYKPSRPHSSRLATHGNVVARVAELQGRAAERTLITVESLIVECEEVRKPQLNGTDRSCGCSHQGKGHSRRLANREARKQKCRSRAHVRRRACQVPHRTEWQGYCSSAG